MNGPTVAGTPEKKRHAHQPTPQCRLQTITSRHKGGGPSRTIQSPPVPPQHQGQPAGEDASRAETDHGVLTYHRDTISSSMRYYISSQLLELQQAFIFVDFGAQSTSPVYVSVSQFSPNYIIEVACC